MEGRLNIHDQSHVVSDPILILFRVVEEKQAVL